MVKQKTKDKFNVMSLNYNYITVFHFCIRMFS